MAGTVYKFFVPPRCDILKLTNLGCEVNNDCQFLNELYTILSQQKSQCYVIIGDPGTGKTFLARSLYYIFKANYDSHKSDQALYPIYVDTHFLTDFGSLEIESDSALNVVLFDGYTTAQLLDAEISLQNSICVHFIRTGYFSKAQKDKIFGIERQEIYLENFGDSEIDTYLNQFDAIMERFNLEGSLFEPTQSAYRNLKIETSSSKIFWERSRLEGNPLQFPNLNLRHWVTNLLPNLKQVGKNPFLLSLIAQHLPVVLKEFIMKGETKLWVIRAEIFKIITDAWFQNHVNKFIEFQKNSKIELSITPECLVNYCRANAINWAQALMNSNQSFRNKEFLKVFIDTSFLEPIHDSAFFKNNWITHLNNVFSKDTTYLKAIQSSFMGSFNAVNDIEFFDYSLMEYFVDKHIFSGIIGEFEFYYLKFIKPETMSSVLNLSIIDDLSTLDSLATVVQTETDPRFEQLLFEIIYASKSNSLVKTVAANAITVLNVAGVSFYGRDFSHAQVAGANLGFSLTGNVDFRGSDLENVSFQESLLTGTNFEGANVRYLNLGIKQAFTDPNIRFPSFIGLWKRHDSQLFLFVLYKRGLPKQIKICKLDSTGKVVAQFHRKRPSAWDSGTFQIFDSKLGIITWNKIKVFDLTKDKWICTFIIDSPPSDLINVFPTTGVGRSRESAKVNRIKFNSSGQFLVVVSGYFVFRIFKVDFKLGQLCLEKTIKLTDEILSFNFFEKSSGCFCVFLCLDKLLTVNLTNFELKTQSLYPEPNEFLISHLESVLISDERYSLEAFSINPKTEHLNIAIFGNGLDNCIDIYEFVGASCELKYQLRLEDLLEELPSYHKSTLVYKENILICIAVPSRQDTSTILVWCTSQNAYTLVYMKSFGVAISQVVVEQICPGIYEVGLISLSYQPVKTIVIKSLEAYNTSEISQNSTFMKKFTPPEQFYDKKCVRFSPDMNKVIALTLSVVARSTEGYLPLTPRAIEIWDLNTGRLLGSITLHLRMYDFLIEWLRSDLIIFVNRLTRTEACLYSDTGNLLRDWSALPQLSKLTDFRKLEGFDDVLKYNRDGSQIFIKFFISAGEITFKKIDFLPQLLNLDIQSLNINIIMEFKFSTRLPVAPRRTYLHTNTPGGFRVFFTSDWLKDMLCVEFYPDRPNLKWNVIWSKLSYTDFSVEKAIFKNAINLNELDDGILKVHGARGIKSIPREVYVAKADLLFPIPGTGHLERTSKFPKEQNISLTFDELKWIVSAVVVKTPSSGIRRREHLALICEGQVHCRQFKFKAELYRKGKFPFINITIFKTMEEIGEFISKEKVRGKWVYFQRNITYEQGDTLINSILLDRKTKYKTLTENCVKWVIDKLEVIGFRFKKRRRDWWATRSSIVQNLEEEEVQ